MIQAVITTTHLDTREIWSSYKFKNVDETAIPMMWANVDRISSNGYHEKTNHSRADHEEHWPELAERQKSKTFIDFAVLVADGTRHGWSHTFQTLEQLGQSRVVSADTSAAYKSFSTSILWAAFILASTIWTYTHITSKLIRTLTYISEVTIARIHICISRLHLYLSIHIHSNIFTSCWYGLYHLILQVFAISTEKISFASTLYVLQRAYHYNYTFL